MRSKILIVLLILTNISFPQSYSHLFELRGIEDSTGNTHLFYRYGGVYDVFQSGCWSKSIYHFDLTNNIDTLFIEDVAVSDPFDGCYGTSIFDYEFFNNNPAHYIYGGVDYNIDPAAILVRYDGDINLDAFGTVENIEISQQNQNLLYLVISEHNLLKSIDGGYNWTFNFDSLEIIDYALVSLSKNDDSQIYGIDNNKLVRSEDEGYSHYIVDDDSHWSRMAKLYYDPDAQHIYGVTSNFNEYALLISNSNGDPFSWNLRMTSPATIHFTNDENTPGEVYYAIKRRIFKSTDFGTTFSLYRVLDRSVTGLYKKSGSDILYASTPLKIYEIPPDTFNVIKNLPVPESVLRFYPLQVGNRWVYDEYTFSNTSDYHGLFIREVTGDTILPNNKLYYAIKEYYDSSGITNYSYERIDTSSGLIYRYYEDPGLQENEYVIDDLLAFIGDTIWTSRQLYDSNFPTVVTGMDQFQKWDLHKTRILYKHLGLGLFKHSLTRDIGLDSLEYEFDFGFTYQSLKGCVIDGTVYGDTTVVSVEDEIPNLPTEFYLSQNYPNPFNPGTKIKFVIPSPYQGEGQRVRLTTLKVYDVLGKAVATLVNEELPPGEYEVEFDATGLPSGVYFYQLKAGDFIQTKKMALIR